MKLSSPVTWRARRMQPGGLKNTTGRGFVAASLAVFFLGVWTSCHYGSPDSGQDSLLGGPSLPPGFGTPNGPLDLPILFGIDNVGDEDTICVGQVITLRGLNFSPDLTQNVVIFQAGSKEIRTVPIAVAFPADTNPLDGRDSLLRVLVPTGASTGSIQLFVNGNFANQQGIVVCPMILGSEVGINRAAEHLVYSPPIGFDPQFGPDTVWIHGLNFEEVTDVVIEDSDGRRFVVGPQVFRRPRLDPDNGLDSIRFPLTNAKLGIKDPRDNLRIWVLANDVQSNEVTVPVQTLNSTQGGAPLGASINGVILPWGVRSGPVRINYSLYDRPVSMSYRMIVEWTVNGGIDWFPALSDMTDPAADGTQSDLPDVVLPGSLFEASRYQLIRGGGGFRTYTWDAPNDPNFRLLNESADANGNPAPRNWSLSFRISANPSFIDGTGERFNSGVLFVTPPLSYYDLQDRPGDDASDLRQGTFTEDFGDNKLREDRITDALWGPPFNRGTLEGQLESRAVSQFGTGEFDLVMDPFPLAERPDEYLGEFYEIDTTRLRISHIMILDDPDLGPVEEATIVFPTTGLTNPGEENQEFHLRTWTIADGMDVRTRGSSPLVVRLSGPDRDEDRTAFYNGGVIDANGFDGATPTACRGVRGFGAPGILGSGAGGDGATIYITTGAISQVESAEDGGRTGGGGGLTTTAVDPDITSPNNVSRYNGSPGGGGGNLQAGAPGDGGRPQPTTFPNPRGGHAGPKRGSPFLNPLSPGSGGGGGGASMIGIAGLPGLFAPVWGGGGGSGGGAIHVVADGDIVFGETGEILANGGNGGDADTGDVGNCPGDRAGPGGGGSGGCVFLRSSGVVVVDCHQIQVNGGQPGDATSAINSIPGSGVGADGRIRLESRGGGVPFCNTLPILETTLTSLLRRNASARTIDVQDATAFPTSGKLRIDDELVSYSSTTATSFTNVVRAIDGTDLAEHPIGTTVQLLAVLSPPEAMVEGGIATAPNEEIDTGLGLDQTLHCTFIPSRDQVTGEILTDAKGRARSIWVFDTESGTVFDPRGFAVKTALDVSTHTNVLQLTRLIVDEGVTLKGEGDLPMVLLIREDADIAGTVDVSGDAGGLIRFDPGNLDRPGPGLGGQAGPGGGDGGTGGTIVYVGGPIEEDDEGNVINEIRRDPTRIETVPGRPGEIPGEILEHYEVTPDLFGNDRSFDSLQSNQVVRATGGLGIRDASCEGMPTGNECADTAGGGGGGGNLASGSDGESLPAQTTNGLGGSRLGTDHFRIAGDDGTLLRYGGSGGGGGGPSIALSRDYLTGLAGQATFRSRARYAPGTGGGGGGGILHVAVRGAFFLRATGRILANGGGAYQSIDLGGNGGAGAAGSIFIQVRNNFTVEPGAVIEARGGKANLGIPTVDGVALYEGNIRSNGTVYGGLGGDGAPGRVRIEAPRSSLLGQGSGTVNSSMYTGFTPLNAEESVAYSVPIALGLGPGGAVLTHDLEVTQVTVRGSEFGQPGETLAIPLWWVGGQSRNVHGRVDETVFHTRVDDPVDLSQGIQSLTSVTIKEFLRFEVRLVSDNITRETPAIQRITVEYRMKQ